MSSPRTILEELHHHVQLLDQKIRLGEFDFVQKELDGLELDLIPRSYAQRIANLARRCSRSLLAVKILHPIVRPVDTNQPKAEGHEIAEYAAALSYLGASQEAIGLLKKVNPEEYPQCFLYLAFALFSRWEYDAAVAPLKSYLDCSHIGNYDRLIGKLNLAAALIRTNDYSTSKKLLEAVVETARKENFSLILGNALERLAEIAVSEKNWRTADHLLFEAEGLVKDRTTLSNLFIRKWRLFLQILSKGYMPEYEIKLKAFKLEAASLSHWETVRDCDRFEALITKSKKLFLQVYFGTPFESFRKDLIEEFKTRVQIPNYFIWGPEVSHLDTSPISLDIENGTLMTRDTNGLVNQFGNLLVPGSLPHQLLMTLASDFYSPFGYRYLFAALFPEKNYHPQFSDQEVLVAIETLKKWLSQNNLPLDVEERGGFFKLKFLGSITLKVHR